MRLDILLEAIPLVVSGLWLTLQITILSFVVGQVVGLPIALAAASRSRFFSLPAQAYIFLVRGSPLLVQLFIIYYGLGQISFVRGSFLWTVLRDPVNCVVLSVGLNSAAYVGELLRGAITQVARGQREAAGTLGLSRRQTLALVVLPQVYRAVIPPLGNELVLVLKASSLGSAVTIMEMTGAARVLVARTYAPFEVFAVAGILYLAIGMAVAHAFGRIERLSAIPGSPSGRG